MTEPVFPAGKTIQAGEIENLLKKLYSHPALYERPILKKFLSFIVHETLGGRASYLKEYTIAVNALHKPSSFDPQKSCVVRIHARRLRDALQLYYMETANAGDIVISIPKGQYVPLFEVPKITYPGLSWIKTTISPVKSDVKKHTIAVYPFKYNEACIKPDFADSIGLQLAASLVSVNKLSVFACQITRPIAENCLTLKEFADKLNCRYVISGNIQAIGKLIRVNVQLIECTGYKQCWGKILEYTQAKGGCFTLQDTICSHIVEGINYFIG